VWPPEEIAARLRLVPHDGWRDVRWIPEQNWHVTLAFLGEADSDGVTAALRRVALPTVIAEISSRLRVLGRTSLVLPVAGVGELARAVRTATVPERADRPFRGHLTMARSRSGRPIKGGRRELEMWDRTEFEIREIALVASTLTHEGSRYSTVATLATTESR
jgi:2'-5' RNA ligase